MHVLIVTPTLPYPPQQGAALRNFGILSSIASMGHTVTLLTFTSDPDSPPAPALAALCDQIITVPTPPRSTAARVRDLVVTGQPDLARRLHSDTFAAAVRRIVTETRPDVIQFEGLEVAAYAPIARAAAPNARLVYDAHNAEYALQRNIARIDSRTVRRLAGAAYSRIQAGRITRLERAICALVDVVIAVSDEDAALLRALAHHTPVSTLPNGIFVNAYAPTQPAVALSGEPLVFTGKMDYRPNVDAVQWFVGSILPLVRETHPDAHLYVVGQSVHRQLAALKNDTADVSFTGWVESVQPFLHGARVFVAPLRMGSGTRLKILEAMAAGCAIVATSIAIAGLHPDVRQALIAADDERAFAGAVQHLLNTADERARLSAAAWEFVKEHYDWSVLAPQLTAIYASLGLAA